MGPMLGLVTTQATRQPAPVPLGAPAGGAAEVRMTAVDWVQVITPIIGGLAGGAAFVLSARGQDKLGSLMLATWAIITSVGGAFAAYGAARQRALTRAGIEPVTDPSIEG